MALKVPNDHKILILFPSLGPTKYIPVGIFGMKIYTIWQPCDKK
jgi:hypothetical protein